VARPQFALYSQIGTAEQALSALGKLVPTAEIEEDAENGGWKRATVSWKRSLWRSPLKLTISHRPDYYTSERWSAQLQGMQAYVQRFANAKERGDVLTYLAGLRFAIHFSAEPAVSRDDPRLEFILALADELKGVVFSPTSLVDSKGRIILSEHGARDLDAEVPAHSANGGWGAPDGSPSAMRVAQRLLVMAALTERGLLEVSEEPVELREERRAELVELLKEMGAWPEASFEEQRSLQGAVGALEESQAWGLSWLAEGVLMLGWALGHYPLPGYQEEADLGLLWHLAGLTQQGKLAARLISMASLRDDAEIKRAHDQIWAIHWRLRQFEQDRQPRDLAAFASKAWTGSLDLGMAEIAEEDLAIDGLPLAQVSDSRREEVAAAVAERHKVMRWLMGHTS
jgi:hypothetical protein